MPMASDEVVWSEQGRIHVAFKDALLTQAGGLDIITLQDESAAVQAVGGQTAAQAVAPPLPRATTTTTAPTTPTTPTTTDGRTDGETCVFQCS